MGEVTEFDLDGRSVRLEPGAGDGGPLMIPYDTLIVAGGSHYAYFGHDEWQEIAREVKSLESALTVRAQILSAFEAAEFETDEEKRRAWLTFVVVGGGPTGVEMAGQIGELARDTLRREFRTVDPTSGRILLVETVDRLLTSFPPKLSDKAARSLEHLGVTPLLGHTVVDIDDHGVTIEDSEHREERVPSRTVIWAAGVTASSLARELGEATEADVDRAGRVFGASRPHPAGPSGGVRARRHGPRARRGRPAAAAARGRAGRHAAGALRGRGGERRACAARSRSPSATATRETSRPSAAPAPWPTSRESG